MAPADGMIIIFVDRKRTVSRGKLGEDVLKLSKLEMKEVTE